MTELIRALALFAEPPDENLAHISETLGFESLPSADEYTEIFLFNLYPYASVYLGKEGMLGGEARDRIAGFWRVLNLTPPTEPDHLSTILGLYANLCELSENINPQSAIRNPQSKRFHHARKVFFWEHIASWLPAYLHKMKSIASPFYLCWSEILEKVLVEEANALGKPRIISQHLSENLSLHDPREKGFEDFLNSLIAPARSGMILTRDDFARAANELNLGIRIGERKFMIKSLFGQNHKLVLSWLSNEADTWLKWYQSQEKIFGETAKAWIGKASATKQLLKEMEDDTESEVADEDSQD